MFRHIANLDSIKDSERRRTKSFGILVGQRSTSSREFYKTWLKVKYVIVTATQYRSEIIFQSEMCYLMLAIIIKTHSLHIHNSNKLELFTETSDLQ